MEKKTNNKLLAEEKIIIEYFIKKDKKVEIILSVQESNDISIYFSEHSIKKLENLLKEKLEKNIANKSIKKIRKILQDYIVKINEEKYPKLKEFDRIEINNIIEYIYAYQNGLHEIITLEKNNSNWLEILFELNTITIDELFKRLNLIYFLEEKSKNNVKKKNINLNLSDFREMNLYKIDLSDINLIRSDFRNCKSNYSIFHKCNLFNTIFDNSELIKSDFTEAIISLATFIDCKLIETNFSSCISRETTYRKSNLNCANFSFSNLIDAKFEYCNLHRVNLYKSKLNQCTFKNCDLSSIILEEASLESTIFDSCYGLNKYIKQKVIEKGGIFKDYKKIATKK